MDCAILPPAEPRKLEPRFKFFFFVVHLRLGLAQATQNIGLSLKSE